MIILLDYLEGHPDADRHELAIIEWRYLPLLESRQRPARILHQEMAWNPEFFADVVEMVFQPENSPQPRTVHKDDRTRATLAYQLLRSWRTVPGTLNAAGIHDGPGLDDQQRTPAPRAGGPERGTDVCWGCVNQPGRRKQRVAMSD